MIQRFCLLILSCFVLLPEAAAQKPPVTMQLEALSIRGRSGGAIPIRIKLEHQAPGLLEGDLLLTVYAAEQRPDDILANIRHEGIVLQGTDYFLNLILPPVAHSWNQQYLITSWFETKDGELISLSLDEDNPNEPRELLTPSPMERTTLVCSCSGQLDYQRPSANLRFLNNALSLNNYNPAPPGADPSQKASSTSLIRYYAAAWDALQLPENPLHLTCFDVVVLADRSLGRLDEAQLEALKVWVQAGGSLCVLPDDQSVKSIHESFLKVLFESVDDPSVRISRSEDGKVQVMSGADNQLIHRRFGLGAVSLIPQTESLKDALSREQVGQLVAHLWKLRFDSPVRDGRFLGADDVIANMRSMGFNVRQRGRTWQVQGTSQYGNYINQSFNSLEEVATFYNANRDFGQSQSPLTGAANSELMPEDVEMVPTWIITVLLLGYVAAIGPFDYWFLGLFKARKFTWLLFPVTTLIFTGLTISIAHAYMASTETGGRLSIVDLVDNGQPIRETVLDMNFFGTTTSLEDDFKQSFFVPASMQDFQFQNFNQPIPTAGVKPVNLSGRFPQSFQAQVNLSQWDPFLSRTFRLQPETDGIPEIDWNDASLVTTNTGRQQLVAQMNAWLESHVELSMDAIVMSGRQIYRLPSQSPAMVFDSSSTRQSKQRKLSPYQYGWQEMDLGAGILAASAASELNNFFDVVAQVSPQGDASMEDLPIADLTDPNQWLLMVAVSDGDDVAVYRRVFYVED